MLLRRHPTAVCSECGSALWFGLKTEGNGWKIHFHCDTTRCGTEITAGYISMDSVADVDEAYERAEETLRRW
jgi:hypothetical protein